jgi:hypothetical protein
VRLHRVTGQRAPKDLRTGDGIAPKRLCPQPRNVVAAPWRVARQCAGRAANAAVASFRRPRCPQFGSDTAEHETGMKPHRSLSTGPLLRRIQSPRRSMPTPTSRPGHAHESIWTPRITGRFQILGIRLRLKHSGDLTISAVPMDVAWKSGKAPRGGLRGRTSPIA